jgi:hypothetical protein
VLSILVRCITKSIRHGQLIIYKNNLLAQLSFFSITQTDDPIPLTNFTFSMHYVLGARTGPKKPGNEN